MGNISQKNTLKSRAMSRSLIMAPFLSFVLGYNLLDKLKRPLFLQPQAKNNLQVTRPP